MQAQLADPVETMRVDHGNLSVLFRDNSKSPGELSGLDVLLNVADAPGYDAYDPDSRGAGAGLNFEHIISGHANPNNKFTPRSGPYTLHRLPDGPSVVLRRRAQDSPWKVDSTFRYAVKEPHFVDFEFRCTPRDASLFGPRRYAIFFFANYMNDVEDPALHFIGRQSEDAEASWLRADAPPGHPDFDGGGNYRALAAEDLQYDDDVKFRLNTWSYDWPRIAQPFFYGRAGRGMTLVLMFDRLHTARDQIRFSLYKFKLPKNPRPAWDFQYVINQVEADVEYGFRGRLIWKKFVSAQDCLREYEEWRAALDAEKLERDQQRVKQLKQLGATVFSQQGEVVEVNANRTKITDQDLALLADFTQMTDLSLEKTTIGDAGIAHLGNLRRLEWLNLFQTRISDNSLQLLARIGSLQHLPIGETNVTDAGLVHVGKMKQLEYLGLRGNDVTDDGVKHLQNLVRLKGLHLGETRISDAGLMHLQGMTRLQKLWLDKTPVTNNAIPRLARLTRLRELHLAKTKVTSDGAERLRSLLPRCAVLFD